MKNILNYKGYVTKIEYSMEDKVLYGKIEGIKDLVVFESESATEIENEFHLAVDDYLEMCAELGKEPNKTYSGTFNVRISSELHKALAYYAFSHNKTLNNTVEEAIRSFVDNAPKENIFNIYTTTLPFKMASIDQTTSQTSDLTNLAETFWKGCHVYA